MAPQPQLSIDQQRALAKARARAKARSGGQAFAGVLKPGAEAPSDGTPELLRRPDDPEFYNRAAKAAKADDTLANRLLRGAGQSLTEANRNVDTDFGGVASDLGNIAAAGGQAAAALPVLAYDYLTKTKPKQIGEDVSRVLVETTGAGQLARLQNSGAISLPGAGRETGATTYGATGPDYDPALDVAGFGLGAATAPTRATLGAMASPRSAGREAVAALQDAATNVTMGASDLVGGGVNAARRGINGLTSPRPSPAPVTSVPPTGPRPAQPGPAGAGQQPGAPPVINAVPAAPVVTKGQQRVARDTAKILGRIMRSSRIKDADIRGYLPGAIQRFKSLNDSRVPFAFFLEGDLPNHFPGPIAEEVTTKLRTWGRERNAATGPQDTSRNTTQQTVKGLRESQRDFLTAEAERNLYKGSLIGKEDQILRSLRETGRKGYEPTLAHARDAMEGRRVPTPDERAGFEQLREVLQRPVFRDRIPNDVKLTAEAEGLDLTELIERDPVTAAHWLQSNLRKLEDAAEDIGGKATPASLAYARMRDAILEPLKKAAPGYEGAMKRYGHEFGAKEAVDFGRGLFTTARNARDSAKLIRKFKGLTKRQQTVALMSIRDELLNQFRGTKEGAAAKIARLQEEGTLELLEELGARGKRVADAVRKIAKENEQLRAIDQASGSPTYSNIKGAESAREIVQSPINKAVGAFGDKTSWPMTVAGDVVLASSGLPPVLSLGKAATAAIDRFGNPSAKTLSRATEGLYGLPPQTNGLTAPPRAPRTRRVGGVATPPEEPQDIGALLKRLDEIEADPKLRGGPEGKRILDQIEKARAALPAPSRRPPERAGFFGDSKLPMDEASRMARAREMGFDVDTPLYHGMPRKMEGDHIRTGSSRERGAFLTDDPSIANHYAAEGAEDGAGGFIYSEGAGVYPVFVRGNIVDGDTYLKMKPAERKKIDGVRWGGPEREIQIFDPKNIRSKFASFDPSQEGSSKLLAGVPAGVPEAGGGAIGYLAAPDQNNDGVIDAQERAMGGLGGMVSGFALRKGIGAAASKADEVARNGLFGGKKPSQTPAIDDLLGNPDYAEQARVLRKSADEAVRAAEKLKRQGGDPTDVYAHAQRLRQYAEEAEAKIPRAPKLEHDPAQYLRDKEAGRITYNGLAGERRFNVDQSTFGGVNAKTADKIALGRAQNMEAKGASREDIWNETGWFRGVDGKWRFEIDDSAFKGRLGSILRDKGDLGDFFRDSDAQGAYPDMARVRAERSPDRGSSYDPDQGGRIEFSGRSGALHERQHGIQEAEGFAKGISPSLTPYKFRDPADQAKWDALHAEALAIMREVDIGELSWRVKNAERVRSDAGVPEAVRRHHLANEPGANMRAYLDRYNEIRAESDAMMPRAISAEETYLRHAGEVEARNVQTRRDFTPEERRAKPPWTTEDVPRDQQIVRFGSTKAESRPGGSGPRGPNPPSGTSGGGGPKAVEGPKPTEQRGAGGREGAPQVSDSRFRPDVEDASAKIAEAGQFGRFTVRRQPQAADMRPGHSYWDVYDGEKKVGEFAFGNNGYGLGIAPRLDPEFQRQGIGTQLYDFVERAIGRPLEPAGTQTEAGKALWASRRRAPSPPPKQGEGRGAPTNGLVAPPKKGKPQVSPVVQEVLRDTDRMAIARLLEKKKNADASLHPEIDAQVAALLNRNKKPQKPAPPVLSKEVQDFDRKIKEAEGRFRADRRKFGRFPDQREPIYQAHIDEIADLKRQRAEALARDQMGKGLKKFARQAYNAGPKIAAGLGIGAGAGVIGAATYNGLTAPKPGSGNAFADQQPQSHITPPDDTRYRDDPARNSRNRELVQQVQAQLNALGWRLKPDGIMLGSDSLHGAQTETQKAIRRFQYENNLPVTGLLDADTLDAIDAAYRDQLNRRGHPSPTAAYQEAR